MKQRNPVFLTVLFFLVAIAVNGSCSGADAQMASDELPRHALLFAHHGDASRSQYDIWQVAADGTQMASVVVLPGHQDALTLSPDGNELIYVSVVDGKRDLWRRDFSRGEAVNITASPANDSGPSWSPDGKRLLFHSDRDGTHREMYVMTLETGTVDRITRNDLHDSDGAWSPDGNRIVYSRYFPDTGDENDGTGRGELVEFDFGTQEERQLTRLDGYCGGVDFSPDGRFIAFHRVAGGGSEIWIMGSDGSDAKPLTDTLIDEYSPVWSPDGAWIAYTAGTGSDGAGTFDLWIMRHDGTQQQVVLSAPNTQMSPRWRPGDHYLR